MAERLRILLVTPAAPFPADWGGAQRTALLHDALALHGRVDTVVLGAVDASAAATLADRYGLIDRVHERRWWYRVRSRAIGWLSPELRGALRDRSRRNAVERVLARAAYDVLVLRYGATACQLRGLRARHPGVTVLVDVDDALSHLAAPGPRPTRLRALKPALARWIAARERDALREADGLWVVGSRPVSLPTGLPVVRLPNIAFPFPAGEDTDDGTALRPVAFLGVAQFGYPPNREGFDWFLAHVWPAIRARMPAARLRLVGRHPPPRTAARWAGIPGVELTGPVTTLRPAYDAARVAIAPVLRGGGTKIKVIEALTLGVPCVCTAHAATDLDMLPSLAVADDAAAFARRCIDLVTDHDQRRQVAREGMAEIAAHLSPAAFHAGVAALLDTTLGGTRAVRASSDAKP